VEQNFAGLGTVNLWLAAGACFMVIFLYFCALSRQLSYVLWAALLSSVAISLLLRPQMATPILAVGTAAASLLVLISGIQAKRADTALQQELAKLNDAMAALQGRIVLRLSTAGQSPSALRPEESASTVGAPAEPGRGAQKAENYPSGSNSVV
jgi:hypothetical protein